MRTKGNHRRRFLREVHESAEDSGAIRRAKS